MKSKASPWSAPILAVLTLAVGTGALAQTSTHKEFRGVIERLYASNHGDDGYNDHCNWSV